jgi:hypothetical protein
VALIAIRRARESTQLVPLVPPALEARLVRRVRRPPSPPRDPRSARMQALLDRLASHWPTRPYPFPRRVLDEPDPNAIALPGRRRSS